MDIGTGLAVLGSSGIVGKLLGPTADYVGTGIKELAEKRVQNVQAIVSNAIKKLGERINEPGSVPPRVFMEVMTSGSYMDDKISSEYFGGVLASSRSNISRDDRGSTLIALLSRLSTYQIRMHYIFYHIVKKIFDGSIHNIGEAKCRHEMQIFIPYNVMVTGMDFTPVESKSFNAILEHMIFGLQKESLIEDYFSYGPTEVIKETVPSATSGGLLLQPSALGIELFLWAYGLPNLTYEEFLSPEKKFPIRDDVHIPDGSVATVTSPCNKIKKQ